MRTFADCLVRLVADCGSHPDTLTSVHADGMELPGTTITVNPLTPTSRFLHVWVGSGTISMQAIFPVVPVMPAKAAA